MPLPTRRDALGLMAGVFAAIHRPETVTRAAAPEPLPPVRTITRGPKHHWFAYYDKLQFDPSNRLVLGNQVGFEHRSPRAEDEIAVGYVDLSKEDRWTELGTSHAWNWQQGCMLQWMPGDTKQVVWNDRGADGDFVCHIVDVSSGEKRTIPAPIYALAPDGKTAIATDFRRLNDCRPGYGYAGLPDPWRDEAAPERSGIWRVDLATGQRELIVSIATLFRFGDVTDEMRRSKHWFNHLLFNTTGTRIVFLHRWRTAEMGGRFKTRMVTANVDGTDLYVIDPSGFTSHFVWRDERHILAWSRHKDQPGFYVFRDKSEVVEQVGAGILTQDGHCTYLPGTRDEWVLSDTYPDREGRRQHPYLFHLPTSRKVPLGHYHSPSEYTGEWRCDTHPRSSRDGRFAVIDSPHNGTGRQMHLIDLSGVLT